jgi:starch phosphorylase
VESQALYNVLENDVIPCFYDRKNGDVPGRWLKMMKASMKIALDQFSSHRMLEEYEDRFYRPAAERYRELLANDAENSKHLVAQRKKLQAHWSSIQINPPVRTENGSFRVWQDIPVTVSVNLGPLHPDEVDVELYYGRLKSTDSFATSQTQHMTVREDLGNGEYTYGCSITCSMAGRYGFTARITPRGDSKIKYTPGLLTWA